MSAELRDRLFRYCFAIFCTAFAAWARHLCEPLLQGRLPLGFFLLAVVLTGWLAGPMPAMLSLVLGAIASAYVALPPTNSLVISHGADWLVLGVYLIGASVTIALFYRLGLQQRLDAVRRGENEQLSKNLVHADRRQHDYLALLAHELRNPLAPLQTGLEILRRGDGKSADSARLLNVMARQLEHVTRLLDDLLDVTRFAKGQIRFHRQVLDLRCAAKTSIEAITPVVEACEHEFTYHVPAEPIWIRGDRVRLVQIMTNLLSNAAKYTQHAGHIKLHLQNDSAEAVISVTDNGVGIAAADQKRIFELFSQLDGSRSRSEQGLGIGLSLARQLVRAHKGTLSVRSDGPGRGACFEVRLPLVKEPVAANHLPSDAPCEPASARPGALLHPKQDKPGAAKSEAPQRVLVVDDNDDAAETLASLLTFEGLDVQIAHDGEAALEQIHEFAPDVLLLDIGLPGIDGFEVARRIRRTPLAAQPRILAVSGWGGDECERQARDAGIDEHWLKPIDPAAMVNRLSHLRDQELSDGAPAGATPAATTGADPSISA